MRHMMLMYCAHMGIKRTTNNPMDKKISNNEFNFLKLFFNGTLQKGMN